MTTLRQAARAPAGPASWPLTPLSPIEELDHYLDRAREPNLVHLETHTHAPLDRAILQAALREALGAVPEAARRLGPASRWDRHLHWVPGAARGPERLSVASWRTPGELAVLREQLFAQPMPMPETVLRVILAAGPGHDAVILQTSHAAFDGISSLALFTAICDAYQARVIPPAPPAPTAPVPVTPVTATTAPAVPVPVTPAPATTAPATTVRVTSATATAFRITPATAPSATALDAPSSAKPVPLPGLVTRIAAQDAQPGHPGYGFVLDDLPVPWPARPARDPAPTVNDLLVAALILTIGRWNAAHGRRGGRIRITVPVNDRPPQRRWQGSGNQSRLIRVSALSGEAPATLLAHVAAQTRAGKARRGADLDALTRLVATGWGPVVVKQPVTRLIRRLTGPVLTDTSLVTNLGAPPGPPSFSGRGDEPLWISAPAPMPRGVSAGAVTVGQRLYLCLRYRPALMDQAAAAAFTAGYRAAIAELSGRGGPGQETPC